MSLLSSLFEFFLYLVAVYSFFSHRLISIIQKHSKLWPFSSEYLYVWVLLKYAPHFYESLSFLSMLTQYIYKTMGYFRKKTLGLRTWNFLVKESEIWGFHIRSALPEINLGPPEAKSVLLSIRPLRRLD